ncbi:sulfatase-like hydrolase/transferase [Reinekea thalattae]|uniref:Sulfatase-like hydrolase/transferase n=1 Tax=Reinekea thalattae TaxID=2593301 RepID=A0A5C8ZBG4_9GAMM|nr:sulfatase-like hydrolase/transferase [Reinekea thalattae]TXR54784.1 sulfatase-like hydrolase/transferase [Reinekea thalattae]
MSVHPSGLILVVFSLLASVVSADDQPNILLIIADDMGVDASACYSLGDQQANMPTIEAMCQRGKVFENAYAAPLCSPTRATIMSGQYGFRTGVGSAITKLNAQGLSTDTPSLFDLLADTDYSANVIGKWHLAGMDEGFDHPAALGVEEFWGLFSGSLKDYQHWTAVSAGKEESVNEYATTAITDQALSWIGEQQNPWFLWLAYTAPHTPFHLPPSDLHSATDLTGGTQADINKNPTAYYNAMLQALDTEIGRLLASMSADERENTIVMFIGDNGTPGRVARSVYGAKRAKGSIYEGGVHVPFIVSGPNIEPGRMTDLVQTSDLFSTIASLAGVRVSQPDSFDFSPALYGDKSARDYIYVEHFGVASSQQRANVYGWAIRQGDYKLLQKQDAESELYNLATDPYEHEDLFADGKSNQELVIEANIMAIYQAIKK